MTIKPISLKIDSELTRKLIAILQSLCKHHHTLPFKEDRT